MDHNDRQQHKMAGRISALAIVVLTIVTLLLLAFGMFVGVNQDIDAPAAGARQETAPQFIDSPARSAVGDAWNIDYASSYIRFSGIESGAAFEGEWRQWTATIQFDAEAPDTGAFDVRIVATDVKTGNEDRDEALQLSTWFDTENYPEIIYEATQFAEDAENGFVANGFLTVREKRTPVRLEFTVSKKGGGLVLDGNSKLDRIALEVGTSEFADTRWINQFVDVVVHVETANQESSHTLN